MTSAAYRPEFLEAIATTHNRAVTGRWDSIEPAGDPSHPASPDYSECSGWVRDEFSDDQLRLIARALGCTVADAIDRLHDAELDRQADEALP